MLGVESSRAAITYVDDLLIASATIQEHCCHQLGIIFTRLGHNGLTVRLKKSEILKYGIHFGGTKFQEVGEM